MRQSLKVFLSVCVAAVLLSPFATVQARDYAIDIEGAHAFVQFRVKHLGISWLYGRFNKFDGEFSYDPADDSKNSVEVVVDVASIDSNHAERDKHLRSADFLNVKKFPEAKFVSKTFTSTEGNKAKLVGDLTLMGVTKEVTLDVVKTGEGKDPWGGYRSGFEGTAVINAQDFGMPAPWLTDVEMTWTVEGIAK